MGLNNPRLDCHGWAFFMPKEDKHWYQPKGYLHITPRLNRGSDREKITAIVSDPKLVTRHAFFPLLHKKIAQRRYKVLNEDSITGEPVRGHSRVQEDGNIKLSKKIRPIHYATHIDSQIYSYYAKEILQPKYEAELAADADLNRSIIAYRRIPNENGRGHKGNIHFAKEVFDEIRRRGDCVAMAFDIENFFSSLNHRQLKRAWAKLLGTKSLPKDHYNLFKSITRFSYIDIDQFRQTNQPGKSVKGFDERKLAQIRKKGKYAFFESVQELREAIKAGELRVQKNQFKNRETGKLQGIPQGLAISALLANVYLLEFDRLIVERVVKEWGGMYRRYSDDIVIIVSPDKKSEVNSFILKAIEASKLVISEEKTEICRFERVSTHELECYGSIGQRPERKGMPFCYLGFEFDGKKVLIKAKNVSKFYRKMKEAVKSKAKQIERVKEKTNDDYPVIRYRTLSRSYTERGAKKRMIPVKKTILHYDPERREYYLDQVSSQRKYWGNSLGYAKRASEIMDEPSIERQFRNHWKILLKVLKRHGLGKK